MNFLIEKIKGILENVIEQPYTIDIAIQNLDLVISKLEKRDNGTH